MNEAILDWIDKAEGDWHTMLRESEAVDFPNFDAVCFHAQQCTEKYLKARLIKADIPFRKTHDLLNLLKSVSVVEPDWLDLSEELSFLNAYGIAGRYPGLNSTSINSERAVLICRKVRSIVRESMSLSLD